MVALRDMKLPVMIVCATLLAGACNQDCPPSAGKAEPPATNAVQIEMRLLETAMHATLAGLARGDVRGVRSAFEAVDHARKATESAIESQTYVLAKNGDKLARFRQLDDEFHEDAEKLLDVAARNELQPTAEAFGSLMRRCNDCHSEFRN